VADYQMNKDFIAKNLCEKKAIKRNSCQGKCHLKKQMAKAAETEKKSNTSEKSSLEKQILSNRLVVNHSRFEIKPILNHLTLYLENYQFSFHNVPLQPPGV